MKVLFALMLLGYFCGISHAQKLETAESEYEMASSQTASFVISLKEAKEDTYNALTFSMLMPEGINLKGNPILTNKLENPFCISQESIVLPLEISQLNNLMFYALGDMTQNRKIKMAIASASPLPGTDVDSLLTFEIKADENIAPDLYLIKLQSILFEYEPKGKDYGNDITVRIRVYKLGDADKNDAVNVADVTDVINYIMGQSTGDYNINIMLADMNNDGDVDIFDIMKLVNVILTGKLPDPNNAPMRSAGIYEDMLLAFSKNGVTMGIPDAQRFTSFQFEIEIPDDVELTGAELIDASTNHMVQFAKIEDHHYRVVGLSIDNSILSGNNCNNLIDLSIPNCGRIIIHNAMFASPQGQITYFNDTEIEDGITGIRSTSISDTESIYDLLGRKVQMKDGRLPKGIYIINHKRVVVK